MVHCSYDTVTGMGTFAFHTICEKAISYIIRTWTMTSVLWDCNTWRHVEAHSTWHKQPVATHSSHVLWGKLSHIGQCYDFAVFVMLKLDTDIGVTGHGPSPNSLQAPVRLWSLYEHNLVVTVASPFQLSFSQHRWYRLSNLDGPTAALHIELNNASVSVNSSHVHARLLRVTVNSVLHCLQYLQTIATLFIAMHKNSSRESTLVKCLDDLLVLRVQVRWSVLQSSSDKFGVSNVENMRGPCGNIPGAFWVV